MRYTTIIDISEIPEVYKNGNVRLVYLHLVLRAGYHEDDIDQVRTSVRTLVMQTGCSMAAVRHALRTLEKYGLLVRKDGRLYVRKFLYEKKVKKRAKAAEVDPGSTKYQPSTGHAAEVSSAMDEVQAWRKRRDDFIKAYEELEKKAKNGDEEARRSMAFRKKLYEEYKRKENE